jgi:hypothetical protein
MIKNSSARGELQGVKPGAGDGGPRSLVQDLIDDGVYKPKHSIMTIDLQPKVQGNFRSGKAKK